jgi:transcriptional regulator
VYVPARFQETDAAIIDRFIDGQQFATLVSFDGERPVASHVLLELEGGEGGQRYLNGHMARANDQWRTFLPAREVLAIFLGPHTYVSPRWYDHVNVPTWNYLAAHVYGTPRIVTDDAELRRMMRRLVGRYESAARAETAYTFDGLPGEYVGREMKGLVGFQIAVTRVEAAFKLSQNRNAGDFDAIIGELRRRPDEGSRAVADAMERQRAKLFGTAL